MRPIHLIFPLGLACAVAAFAAQPPELGEALRNLRDQHSYSWEVINGDPGPVAQTQQTRRGTVTTIQQNSSPHMQGSLNADGEMLVRCDWPDGLVMESFVAADGTIVTHTPEGWMSSQEILDAITEENAHGDKAGDRMSWLRRADRPELARPDKELAPFIKGAGVSSVSGDTYIAHLRVRPDGWVIASDDNTQPAIDVTFTLNVHNGVLRDYEVKIEGARNFARAGIKIPVNEDRIVVISYVPVTRLDVPDEAREKLKPHRAPASERQ